MNHVIEITLQGSDTPSADIQRLLTSIREEAESGLGYTAEIPKNPETLDFGATLVLVLGTPAVISIARGIAKYLSRSRVKATFKYATGETTLDGVESVDVAKIIAALSKK